MCCDGVGLKRQSRLTLLRGGDGWVTVRENGVAYSLDITRVMYSRGNVTEKARMGRVRAAGEVVVDLFVGIGYFTIPLLVCGAVVVEAVQCLCGSSGVDCGDKHSKATVAFTVAVSMQVHAGAAHVHAVDHNDDALECLRRNVALNRVADRVTIHAGDNR
jgi:tRNA G37 N-methylase Trm5